ncbi:MAG: DNA-directed RNA polymerase subunit beta, partial [Thermodesulfovibrionales bacterium]|nr:DNA-directed RNA polymerase subunit beta [Thermodesulfovibrionales bacterium]
GTVIDVKVLSRKGLEKDDRTKSIEANEIAKLQRDMTEEVKILKEIKSITIRELLNGQKVLEDVKDSKTKDVLCPKGKKLTETHLYKIKDEALTKIKIEDINLKHKIEELNNDISQKIKALENQYNERIERIKKGDELPPGVNKVVKVYIAMKRKIQVGDKMAGRHGNKGVVSMILPEEDMPFLADGRPIDIVLNPLGVPSRMNVGQILETHLGWAAMSLGKYVSTPVFEGGSEKEIRDLLKQANLIDENIPLGQVVLYDGRTGEKFQRPVTVGCMYMLKLHHLVADKIHARSIGPYSLVTQQPLGGKAQFGGQRLGEMEVWALEAYGATHTLQEFLTVKSDDIVGRSRIYDAIVKGDPVLEPGVPESFHVLIKELQSLGLDVELLEKKRKLEGNN